MHATAFSLIGILVIVIKIPDGLSISVSDGFIKFYIYIEINCFQYLVKKKLIEISVRRGKNLIVGLIGWSTFDPSLER